MAQADQETKAFRSRWTPTSCTLRRAVVLVKDAATAKFDESIDVAVQLGVDARSLTKWCVGLLCCRTVQANHARCRVRPGAKAEAKAAGADIVGHGRSGGPVKTVICPSMW